MTGMKQARTRLHQGWQRLRGQWQRTDEQWRDLLRHDFERDFMREYETTVSDTLIEMQRLEGLIAQAQRELSNR